MTQRSVAAGAPQRRATPASFSSPRQLAEEALMEAQARIDRAAADRIRAERAFAAELLSIRADLRRTTAEIAAVDLRAA